MRLAMIKRGLPTLLVLMAVAVILILAGASSIGFAFGLAVSALAGLLLVSALLQDVRRGAKRPRATRSRKYRAPHVRGF